MANDNAIKFDFGTRETERNALMKAVSDGNLATVKAIVKRNDMALLPRCKIWVNTKEVTLPTVAAEKGYEDILTFFLEDCAEAYGASNSPHYRDALIACARSKEKTANDGMCHLLVHCTFSVDDLNAAMKGCNSQHKRDLLCDCGATPSPSCVLSAIEKDDLDQFKKYLKAGHATLDMEFNSGADFPLSMAAMYQAYKIFAHLIELGANPEYKMNGHSVMDRLKNYDPAFQFFARRTWENRKQHLIETAGAVVEKITAGDVKLKIQPRKIRF